MARGLRNEGGKVDTDADLWNRRGPVADDVKVAREKFGNQKGECVSGSGIGLC